MSLQETENGCRREMSGLAESHLGGTIQHPHSLPGVSPQIASCNNDNHPPTQLSITMPSKYGPASSSAAQAARNFANEMKLAREKAILVDRFSRIAFPLAFAILNFLYWYVYFDWSNADGLETS